VGVQQSQFFLLRRRQVQSFDGDYVVAMCCIVTNLDDIDRLERNYDKFMESFKSTKQVHQTNYSLASLLCGVTWS
jgi:hypothetical protein